MNKIGALIVIFGGIPISIIAFKKKRRFIGVIAALYSLFIIGFFYITGVFTNLFNIR